VKPLALVPVALLFAGTAAFAASTSNHPSGSHQQTAASKASPLPDGGNSAAAHSCPKGPHGVHGKCVSAAAHARNAARGHGGGGSDNEAPEASETPEPGEQVTPATHATSPAAATPTATAPPTATPTASPTAHATPTAH
jgi:hypothetical protein